MSAQQRLHEMEGQYSQAADEALNEVTTRGKNFADAWRSKANEQIGITQEDKEQLDELVTGAGLAVQMGQAGIQKVKEYRAQQASKAAKLGKGGAEDAEKVGADALRAGKGTVADIASAGKGRFASLAESAKDKLGAVRSAISDAKDRVGELGDEVSGAIRGSRLSETIRGTGGAVRAVRSVGMQPTGFIDKAVARGISPSEMGGGNESASSAFEGGAEEDASVEISGLAKSTIGGASRFVRGFGTVAREQGADLFGARSVVSDASRSARYQGMLEKEGTVAVEEPQAVAPTLSTGEQASRAGSGGFQRQPVRPEGEAEEEGEAVVNQPVVKGTQAVDSAKGGSAVAKQAGEDDAEDLGAEDLAVEGGVAEIGVLSTVGAVVAPLAIAAGVGLGIYDLLMKPSAHDPPPPPSISTAASRGSGILPSVNNVVDTPASSSAF